MVVVPDSMSFPSEFCLRMRSSRAALVACTVMRLALAVGLILAPSSSVRGCSLCAPYPAKTLADYVIESQVVILAREDPESPFSYAAVEQLKATDVQAARSVSEIELLVDSQTRRELAADPDRVVVLAFSSTAKSWQMLGVADADCQAVVRRIVASERRWQSTDGKRERISFFAQLFGHQNPILFRLAYLELARAPYATIKRLSRSVSRDDILPMLNDRQYFKWQGLAILLLANQATAQDKQHLTDSLNSAARLAHTRNLAALAAAPLGADGEAGGGLDRAAVLFEPGADQKRTVGNGAGPVIAWRFGPR